MHFVTFQTESAQVTICHMTAMLSTFQWTKQGDTSTVAFKSILLTRLNLWLQDQIFLQWVFPHSIFSQIKFCSADDYSTEVQNSPFSLVMYSHDNMVSKTKNMKDRG